MTRNVSDILRIMRLALGRRNENDPDSNDDTLFQYINDFANLAMPYDVKLFEQFDTLSFSIDETNTTGVYTFNDVGATSNFANISSEGLITLTDPAGSSTSWNRLEIYQNPAIFYQAWGINNDDILIPGYPTMMLYYGTELVFRTIPDQSYDVKIFGYKITPEFATEGNPEIPFDYWLRYLAYGAALNYARDYRYEANTLAMLEKSFRHEKNLILTRSYDQAKTQRCIPRF